jgi:hypothetical protein
MSAIATNGGTQIYCNDWASGQSVRAPHGVYATRKNEAQEKRPALPEA